MRAPPAPNRRRTVLPWLCSSTGPSRMPSPQSRRPALPATGRLGLPSGPGAGGRAQQSQAEDRAAMRVDPRSRGEHGRLGLEPDDPQPPHAAAIGAGVGQRMEVRPDGGGTGAERLGVHVFVAAAVDIAHQAGLRPGRQFQKQAMHGTRRDRPPIGTNRATAGFADRAGNFQRAVMTVRLPEESVALAMSATLPADLARTSFPPAWSSAPVHRGAIARGPVRHPAASALQPRSRPDPRSVDGDPYPEETCSKRSRSERSVR